MIDDIWRWNAHEYGEEYADSYVAFLTKAIYGLNYTHTMGRPVPARHDLRYLLLKRRSGGHGLVVVYRVESHAVIVARIYHSAQDWLSRLGSDEGP